MHEINHLLSQLPRAVRLDVEAYAGHTSAMTPALLVAHYSVVAQNLIEQKRSRYQPLPPDDEMARTIFYMLQGNDLSFIGGPEHQPFPRWVTHQVITFLQGFINNLAPLQARLEHEARQLASQAEQEIARLEVLRQAEDAERHSIQEDAAHQLAQQRAEAAAQALATREDEVTLNEAPLALELVTALAAQPVEAAVNTGGAVITPSAQEKVPAHEILFVPGPAVMAEIDRATLRLKHSIDAAVTEYASAILPYLNTPKSFTNSVY